MPAQNTEKKWTSKKTWTECGIGYLPNRRGSIEN